jgi:ATP-dependent exoDNAse (exonuclease V) beta subunit
MPREERATSALQDRLASLLQAQGKLDEAGVLFREALEAKRATLGDRHSDTLTSINNLGTLLRAQDAVESPQGLLQADEPRELPACATLRYSAAAVVHLPVLPHLDRVLSPQQSAVGNAAPPTLASLTGQAMHRLLERLPVQHAALAAPWTAADLAAVTVEFALDAVQCEAAHAMALGILRGTAAWCFDPGALSWAANEVSIQVSGRSLRIDRLVQRRDNAQWWVLDYKSAPAPEQDATLLSQLRSYRDAVARAYPQATVRAAFLTPQGACIEPFTDST